MIKYFTAALIVALSFNVYGDTNSQQKDFDDWSLNDFQSSYKPKDHYFNVSLEFIDAEHNGMGNVVGMYGHRVSDGLDGTFVELQYSRHFHKPSKSETQNYFDYDSYAVFANQYFDLPETAERIRFFGRIGFVYEEKRIYNAKNEYGTKLGWNIGTTYNFIDDVMDLRFQFGLLEEDFNASLGWNIKF